MKTSRHRPLSVFPAGLDLCGPLSKIPSDLWPTQAQPLYQHKASVKGVGLCWIQHYSYVIYLLDWELSCLRKSFFFFSPCCSHSTAHAVTQTATSWFQVLDTQCEIHTHTYVWDIWVGTNLTVSFVTIPWTLRKAKKAAVILLKTQNTTSYWFLFCRYKLRQNLMTASVLGRTLSQRLEWHRELNLITF